MSINNGNDVVDTLKKDRALIVSELPELQDLEAFFGQRHTSEVYAFVVDGVEYRGLSVNTSAQLWADGGRQKLISVLRYGKRQ